ncbi:hypothetical protein [Bradyrhizobium sp. RDI18]|uniref:hypothetical protein n=1 Tax=Bradyrhizobium sp. RDI18 TaxID=3367400 RepID=UPI0037145CB2
MLVFKLRYHQDMTLADVLNDTDTIGAIVLEYVQACRGDKRAKADYIASLSPDDREALRGFELVNPDWRLFRDLSESAQPDRLAA